MEEKFIKYGDKVTPMPAGMTLEQAKHQMARFFPELADPSVETKKDGDKTTYVFSKKAGRKGLYTHQHITPAARFERCSICQQHGWFPGHTCPPIFEVRHAEGRTDEWTRVRATDAEQAAEQFASDWDASDSRGPSDERALVVRDGAGNYTAWTVYGEVVASYRAEEQPFTGEKDSDDVDEVEDDGDEVEA